jgi:uncharacterized membrane protein YoaK (UPF0700 family)
MAQARSLTKNSDTATVGDGCTVITTAPQQPADREAAAGAAPPAAAACQPGDPSRTRELPAAAAVTAGFAVVAGWADVVTFKAFGSFGALMTGNTVKMGLSVFDSEEPGAADAAYYGSILCSYIFGVWLFNLIKHFCPARPGWAASPVCMVLFLAADLLHAPTSDSKWRVCLLAPCFGVQNSLTSGGPLSVNTTVITGNIAQIGNVLWKTCAEGKALAQLKAIVKPLTAWAATFAGAVAGAAVLLRASSSETRWMFWPIGVLQLGPGPPGAFKRPQCFP